MSCCWFWELKSISAVGGRRKPVVVGTWSPPVVEDLDIAHGSPPCVLAGLEYPAFPSTVPNRNLPWVKQECAVFGCILGKRLSLGWDTNAETQREIRKFKSLLIGS